MTYAVYTPSVLRAMARNYVDGHSWDHLDGEAVTKAADEIEALNAENARLREALKLLAGYADWQMKEGADYHPTLPSAIGAARCALKETGA